MQNLNVEKSYKTQILQLFRRKCVLSIPSIEVKNFDLRVTQTRRNFTVFFKLLMHFDAKILRRKSHRLSQIPKIRVFWDV